MIRFDTPAAALRYFLAFRHIFTPLMMLFISRRLAIDIFYYSAELTYQAAAARLRH